MAELLQLFFDIPHIYTVKYHRKVTILINITLAKS